MREAGAVEKQRRKDGGIKKRRRQSGGGGRDAEKGAREEDFRGQETGSRGKKGGLRPGRGLSPRQEARSGPARCPGGQAHSKEPSVFVQMPPWQRSSSLHSSTSAEQCPNQGPPLPLLNLAGHAPPRPSPRHGGSKALNTFPNLSQVPPLPASPTPPMGLGLSFLITAQLVKPQRSQLCHRAHKPRPQNTVQNADSAFHLLLLSCLFQM